MKTVNAIILIAAFMPLTYSTAYGDGTTGADFLNIGVSAEVAATGEASAALYQGPAASHYNPAGLSHTDRFQASGMHSEWLQDLRYEFLGLAIPMGSNGGLGASVSYLSMGDIHGYSSDNIATGNISAYDMALTLSYGHRISPNLSAGIGVRQISEKLDDVSARGFAADLGLQYSWRMIDLGAALSNIGPSLKYETASSALPGKLDFAVGLNPFQNGLAPVVSLSLPFKGRSAIRTGLEYGYANLLVLRSGFDFKANDDGRGGLALGAGIKLGISILDYAYNANSLMGGTHKISFTLGLGKQRGSLASRDNKIGATNKEVSGNRQAGMGAGDKSYFRPMHEAGAVQAAGSTSEKSEVKSPTFSVKLDLCGGNVSQHVERRDPKINSDGRGWSFSALDHRE